MLNVFPDPPTSTLSALLFSFVRILSSPSSPMFVLASTLGISAPDISLTQIFPGPGLIVGPNYYCIVNGPDPERTRRGMRAVS